jgi:tyrosinase
MPTKYRFYWCVVAVIAALTTGVNAMAAESPETLATSSGKPVALGAGPVAVTLLAPASGSAAPLSARVATVRRDRKVYLVVRGLATNEQPEVVYQVYLGLPPGVAPKPEGLYYVGSLNFFNAPKSGPAAARDPRFYSFDVTDLLSTLQSSKSLGEAASVTIVPADKPRDSARPVIGEIALVEQ